MRQIRLYYLTEELYERLRKVAFERRISHSELLRRALEEYLKKLDVERGKNGSLDTRVKELFLTRDEDYEPDTLFEVGLMEKYVDTPGNK